MILNSIVCLDIAGSMSLGLTSDYNNANRISFAKEALKDVFSRMRKNDSFWLVVFDDMAETILPVQMKS